MGLAQRREEEKQERIALILRAALRLFAEKGYSDCNMQDIATAARLGKATLYYYFPNKEVLFRYLLREETARFYQLAAEQVAQTATAGEAIEQLIHFYIDYFSSHPDLLHLFFPLGRSSPLIIKRDTSWRAEVNELRKPLETRLYALFQSSPIKNPPDQVLKLLWTFLIGISIKMVQDIPLDSIRQEAELFLQMHKEQFISHKDSIHEENA